MNVCDAPFDLVVMFIISKSRTDFSLSLPSTYRVQFSARDPSVYLSLSVVCVCHVVSFFYVAGKRNAIFTFFLVGQCASVRLALATYALCISPFCLLSHSLSLSLPVSVCVCNRRATFPIVFKVNLL